MLADPLTKAMSGDNFIEAMKTHRWDLSQPVESPQKKRFKYAQRPAAKKNQKMKATEAVEPELNDYCTVTAHSDSQKEHPLRAGRHTVGSDYASRASAMYLRIARLR